MTQPDHRTFMKHFLAAEAVLKAYLLSASGDMNAADELLGEVSSVLWEKFDRYDPARGFRPWAFSFTGSRHYKLLRCWPEPGECRPEFGATTPRHRGLARVS